MQIYLNFFILFKLKEAQSHLRKKTGKAYVNLFVSMVLDFQNLF